MWQASHYQSHLLHLTASAVAPETDTLMIFKLQLSKLGSDHNAEESLDLFPPEREELASFHARILEMVKKPKVSTIAEEFVTFKAQENKHGV